MMRQPPAFAPGQMGQMGYQQPQMQPQMGMHPIGMQAQMQPQMGMEMQPQMQPQMGMGMQFFPMMVNPGYNNMVNGNTFLNAGMYNARNAHI
jgi:hypothetical protein